MKNTSGSHLFEVGGSINSISASPDWKFVVVAGRDVIKILSLEKGDQFLEAKNLRRGHKGSNLMMSANDVKWCRVAGSKNLIATAASTSAVVIWDVEAERKADRRKALQAHHRAANSVCWHNVPFCLVSASQDGTILYWDTRVPDAPQITFQPRSDAVREVDFNPFYGNYFAAAFDDGTVQAWDIRKPNQCERRLTAHDGMVLSVAWHPQDSSILASGGRDGTLKIWDLNVANRPRHHIQTIAAVGKVSWRPKCTYQLCSGAAVIDFSMQIWDLHRPSVPLACLGGHSDVITGMVWPHESPGAVITASKDGKVGFHKIRKADFPSQKIRATPMCWNPNSEELALVPQTPDRSNPEDTPAGSDSSAFGFGNLHPSSFVKSNEKILSVQVNARQLLDKASFAHMASHYKTAGDSFCSLCLWNAKVAREASRPDLCPVWEMLVAMLDGEEHEDRDPALANNTFLSEKSDKVERIASAASVQNRLPVRRNLNASLFTAPLLHVSEDEGEAPLEDLKMDPPVLGLSDSEEESPEKAAPAESSDDDPFREHRRGVHPLDFKGLKDVSSSSASVVHDEFTKSVSEEEKEVEMGPSFFMKTAPWTSSEIVVRSAVADWAKPLAWDPVSSLQSVFESLLDGGDVQTPFHLALVIGIPRLSRASWCSEKEVKRWCVHYLDLLSQMQLWSIRNCILQCVSWLDVRELNQKGTSFALNCPTCQEPLSSSSWLCSNCKKVTASCSLCKGPVKGLFSWCQGCGHGGHAKEMLQWWKTETSCPEPACFHECKTKEAL